jgi:hypothetical protein
MRPAKLRRIAGAPASRPGAASVERRLLASARGDVSCDGP